MPELRQRGGTKQRSAEAAAGDPPASADNSADLPNPLTLQAVSTVFRRRWAVPMTVAVLCLVVHYTGILDDPNQPQANQGFDFSAKLALPLHHAKYGIAGGAIFGSLLWVIVVSLSDPEENKGAGPTEHWAQDDKILLMVLLGLGMATGGVCSFAMSAVWDLVRSGGFVQEPQIEIS
eukprot:CAMPEP_0177689800 /NCGR_PEP_ID=MMETSP0484_2-20121128/403_1 /TAXON_ID=354590 /ORGANISM="Rhodomonas lens, Strain RHODO" /LENGTH=176 /DNA_ID=CAMNT_0019200255 /DNA_START=60 /DNA_END=590 /DNA_ORIENTATION=-